MLRALKILEHALGCLLRRKGKNLAICVVYTFTVATLASVLFLSQALRREAGAVLRNGPDLVVQRLTAGRHDLIPHQYAEVIAALPGVAQVTPRVWGYYYDSVEKANYTLLGVTGNLGNMELLEGTVAEAGPRCAIGDGIAATLGACLGDSLVLVDDANHPHLFEITGRFRSESGLLTHDLIVFPEAELRRFFQLPDDRATDLAVQVYNPREIPTLANKIKDQLPGTRPIAKTEMLHTYTTVFDWRSGILLTICFAALVAFCILAWDKATGISAQERREIGILKAIGWDTGDVLLLKFWEGLAISLASFLLGSTLAYVHVFFFRAGVLASVLRGWSVLFPKLPLTPAVDPYQLFLLATLTVVPYLACTVIPSWHAASTDPDHAMRS